MQKLYCYIDEFGQHTNGDLFLVSVVIAEEERDSLIKLLDDIEKTSGKGKVKWIEARHDARNTYIRTVLQTPEFQGKLHYAVYRNTRDYLPRTVLTTARAILADASKDYKATVFVDGLPKSRIKWFGTELRHLYIKTDKVRGVRGSGKAVSDEPKSVG